jgi:hypothetical protein
MLLRVVTALIVASSLAGCEPAWYSLPSNPAACPHDSLPSGSCTGEGTGCAYEENAGRTQRPPLYESCACSAALWTCTVGATPRLSTDAGAD